MKLDFNDFVEAMWAGILFALMAVPPSMVVSFVIYTTLDNADTSFVEKCVHAGATHKACFEVVNPPDEQMKGK